MGGSDAQWHATNKSSRKDAIEIDGAVHQFMLEIDKNKRNCCRRSNLKEEVGCLMLVIQERFSTLTAKAR